MSDEPFVAWMAELRRLAALIDWPIADDDDYQDAFDDEYTPAEYLDMECSYGDE